METSIRKSNIASEIYCSISFGLLSRPIPKGCDIEPELFVNAGTILINQMNVNNLGFEDSILIIRDQRKLYQKANLVDLYGMTPPYSAEEDVLFWKSKLRDLYEMVRDNEATLEESLKAQIKQVINEIESQAVKRLEELKDSEVLSLQSNLKYKDVKDKDSLEQRITLAKEFITVVKEDLKAMRKQFIVSLDGQQPGKKVVEPPPELPSKESEYIKQFIGYFEIGFKDTKLFDEFYYLKIKEVIKDYANSSNGTKSSRAYAMKTVSHRTESEIAEEYGIDKKSIYRGKERMLKDIGEKLYSLKKDN